MAILPHDPRYYSLEIWE